MKLSRFARLLCVAVCAKLVIDSIFISLVFAFILGFMHEERLSQKALLLGLAVGAEAAGLEALFGAHPWIAVGMNVFRTFGIPVSGEFMYSTIVFLSFALVIAVELILVCVMVEVGSLAAKFASKYGIRIV